MKKIGLILTLLTTLLLKGQTSVVHTVYFDVDKDQFSFSEGKQLNSFFDDLLYKPILSVKILGYCDDRGSNAYNLDLSNRRVQTVSNWLENHDIALKNISQKVEGLGEIALEDNLTSDEVDLIRAENRRVDIEFYLKEDIADRITIKKIKNSDLNSVEAQQIDAYEKKVVNIITSQPNDTTLIQPVSIPKPELTKPEQTIEYLEIPTKIDPPVDNNSEPFKSLLKKELQPGEVIQLENILFYKGRSTVLKESEPLLDRVAEILAARKDIIFEIHGHVCCINPAYPDAYNRDTKKSNLSHARALAIYKFLRSHGVNHRRMKFKGYGRTKPLGGPEKLDRRVEIVITKILPNK